MPVSFYNPARSLDARNRRVRFWGYDRAMEISFFVEMDALRKLIPDMKSTDDEILRVFDAARERIHAVAEKLYARQAERSYSCVLVAQDF